MKGEPMSNQIVHPTCHGKEVRAMAIRQIDRLWAPYTVVARDYLGISPDILRGAIARGELAAYEKPLTRGRKPSSAKENHIWLVYLPDVDEYIRTCWALAKPS